MQTFHCDHCGHLVFFENVFCEACGHTLGYLTDLHTMSALELTTDGLWSSRHPNATGYRYRMCSNYAQENVCNWMLPAHDPHTLCESCRLTEIIPALCWPQNRAYWYRMEQAKRRLLYTLSTLGLVPVGKAENPWQGLAFHFLADNAQTGQVVTGHDSGVITLNIAEADDIQRERTRSQLGEPYRTLLGHFHHEIGHYYWDRLINGSFRLAAFRQLFGDERADYDANLQRHYNQGPPADWPQYFVSDYASAHPWEDWAETWAQYLQMVDALDTVQACGMTLSPTHPDDPTLIHSNQAWARGSFDDMLERWFPLSYLLNNLHRSLGMPDGYQFSLAAPVVSKLRFVHEVVTGQ
ncbi:MAG: putative zinc-binding metallopeptidase [Formivibrio sp.]|nr:putative zinc-binding metallopeptidase [Formivibrio sp.]